MRDASLMNPAFIHKQIDDLENILIPQGEEDAEEIKTRINKALDVFRSSESPDRTSYVLTKDEMTTVVSALAGAEVRLYNYHTWHEHALRSYRILLKDRRWIIASKLKFLATK